MNRSSAGTERGDLTPTSFEILLVRDLGGKFGQRKNFISELERAVPDFYEQIGQHLKAWQPRAPRVRDDKQETADLSTEALHDEAKEVALERQE